MAVSTPSTRRGQASPADSPSARLAVGGRTAPHSTEAEESIIACCLLDGGDSVSACLEGRLAPESFYSPSNRVLFEVICDIYRLGHPIDAAVLGEELRKRNLLDSVGGFAQLSHITNRIPTTAHRAYYIQQVKETQILRELIRAATGAVEDCYGFTGGIQEFIDKVEQSIFSVTQDRVGDAVTDMDKPVNEAFSIIAKMLEKAGALTGISSGFIDLDKLLFGFQKSEMIVLAARPSMGKTSLMLNFVEAAAMPQQGKREAVPTLVFSLEMSSAQIALRMLCSHARVKMDMLRQGFVGSQSEETSRLGEAAKTLKAAPVFVDDSSQISIMELRAKARRVHSRLKLSGRSLGLIVVDYLQLVSGTDPKVPREQQVAEISRGLKALAKELEVPVIVLSQLNRASEKENRAPRLSDLRESGSIEQDADVVLMLSRPRDADEKYQVAADLAELTVAKQRNGPVGEIKLTFLREITRFENHI